MAGIPPHLISALREALANCEPFETNRDVRNLFADKRIKPWQNSLPQSDTLMGRVDNLIGFLHDKKNSNGLNALVLMLLVLVDKISSEDSRYNQLTTIVHELAKEFGNELPQTVISSTKTILEEGARFSESPKDTPPIKCNQTGQTLNTKTRPVDKKNGALIGVEKIDFFISYNRNDKKWAEWIAWQLENVGYTTIIQAWDFRPGGNFIVDMQKATTNTERTIAILSPDYLASKFTQPEWNAAFALDPTGEEGLLLPVKVRNCELTGLLPQIVYIDLVDLTVDEARDVLLRGVKRGRAKPIIPPNFPGAVERAEPKFPEGPSNISNNESK